MYTHYLHLEPRVIPPLCCPLFSNCWAKLLRWTLKGKGEGKNMSAMRRILFHKRIFYLFWWHQTVIKYFFFCMKSGPLSHIVRFFWVPKEKPCENICMHVSTVMVRLIALLTQITNSPCVINTQLYKLPNLILWFRTFPSKWQGCR